MAAKPSHRHRSLVEIGVDECAPILGVQASQAMLVDPTRRAQNITVIRTTLGGRRRAHPAPTPLRLKAWPPFEYPIGPRRSTWSKIAAADLEIASLSPVASAALGARLPPAEHQRRWNVENLDAAG